MAGILLPRFGAGKFGTQLCKENKINIEVKYFQSRHVIRYYFPLTVSFGT
jgi:hypothetical protein